MAQVERPRSPHLQVYRWSFHMAASIINRAAGVVLAVGMVFLAWWLVAIATGHDYFNTVQGYAGSPLGRLVLFGITYALMQHLAGGVRHLFMDMGKLYDLKSNTASARFTFIFAIVATIIIWVAAYKVMGVL